MVNIEKNISVKGEIMKIVILEGIINKENQKLAYNKLSESLKIEAARENLPDREVRRSLARARFLKWVGSIPPRS